MDAAANSHEGDRLDVLSTLVTVWEDKHHAIQAPDPVEAILFMMDQRGLSRRDMEPYIGNRARVSEVLNHRREFNITDDSQASRRAWHSRCRVDSTRHYLNSKQPRFCAKKR